MVNENIRKATLEGYYALKNKLQYSSEDIELPDFEDLDEEAQKAFYAQTEEISKSL